MSVWSDIKRAMMRPAEITIEHPDPLSAEAEHHRKLTVARAMFAPLDSAGFHPSGSQMDEAARVIDLIERKGTQHEGGDAVAKQDQEVQRSADVTEPASEQSDAGFNQPDWPARIRLVQVMDFSMVPNFAAEPAHLPVPSEPHETYIRLSLLTSDKVVEAANEAAMKKHHFHPYPEITQTLIEAAAQQVMEEEMDDG